MSKLETVWDYIHDCITNDKLTFIAITSAAEGKIESEGFQFGQGKSTLAGGISGKIHEAYHSLGKYEAEEMVKESYGYSWDHMKQTILRGYKKRQLVYVADDLQQIAGKHMSHNKGVKWMAYQLTTKRPQLAVFIATCPHLGTLAKCWRELFDWEIKVPVRGLYEVQQIKTFTVYKDPLNPLKRLIYKGEAEFPKASAKFEAWYRAWRDVENEDRFVSEYDQYLGTPQPKAPKPISQEEYVKKSRELGIKVGSDILRNQYKEIVAPLMVYGR